MKAKTSLLLLTLATTLGLSGPVVAKTTLETPDELVCETDFDNSVQSSWGSVEDATYYAVVVTGKFGDMRYNFHFGTTDPELDLEESDLMATFWRDNQLVEMKPEAAEVRVQAVRVAKGHTIGVGHEKAIGEGHYKDHGTKTSDYAECEVTFAEPAPDPGPCTFRMCP